tara:strand:+ start:97 stop:3135 length:3039 start_codon:yes stop_codon:yes gene_type:complete
MSTTIDPTLLTLFQQLMENYDSTLDTSQGSVFYQSVILPILERVGGDPLDVNVEEFLAKYLSEQMPTVDTSTYSGVRDLVIRPMALMMGPMRREINAIRNGLSFRNADTMTNDELDLLLSNFFMSRNSGLSATGIARIYFAHPITASVTPDTEFSTSGGLVYNPQQTTVVSSVEMAFNRDSTNGLYYMDVPIVAELPGTEYNVAPGAVSSVSGVVGAISVTNLFPITSGTADETRSAAVTRAQNSVTAHNLLTKQGIDLVLKSQNNLINDLTVVGAGEDEMLRDIVYGPVTISGVPGGYRAGSSTTVPVGGIHVGGKTDVYVNIPDSTAKVAGSLSIQDYEDVGRIIFYSQTAYVTGYTAGVSQLLYDTNGNFDLSGVKVNDYVYYKDRIFIVAAVNADYLTLSLVNSDYTAQGFSSAPANISFPSSGIYYEVRRPSRDNRIRVTLHDLIAVDSSGAAIYDPNTSKAIQPLPGDPNLSASLDSAGAQIVKTSNLISSTNSDTNIKLPMFRISSVGLGIQSGNQALGSIVWGEALGFSVVSMTRDTTTYLNPAVRGTIRVFLKDKSNITSVPAHSNFEPSGSATYDNKDYRLHIGDPTIESTITGPILKSGEFLYGVEGVTKALTSGNTDPHASSMTITALSARTGILSSTSIDPAATDHKIGDFLYVRKGTTDGELFSGATPTIWPPVAGMYVWVVSHTSGTAAAENNKRLHLIEEVTSTTNGTSGSTNSGSYWKLRLRKGHNVVSAMTLDTAQTTDQQWSCVFLQGANPAAMSFDESRQLYYYDFKVWCLNDTTAAAVLPTDTALERFSNDNNENADFYVEGWSVRSNNTGYGYSSKEQPVLILTDFVVTSDESSGGNITYSSQGGIYDKNVAFDVTISYEHMQDSLGALQTFVDADANRIVSEDILVKNFLPAIPFFSLSAKGLDVNNGGLLLSSFVENIPSSNTFEVSDLISYLYDSGSTYVLLPINVVILSFDQNRKPSIEFTQTTTTLSKIERYYGIESGTSFTVLT